jgi:lysophospholipase
VTLLAAAFQPPPAGADVFTISTADGIPLRCARWLPETDHGAGTVLLLQGRAEFIEKYYETIEDLRTRGFTVLTFDWRGQGGSGRDVADERLGHVRHFSDFRLDYEAVRALVPAGATVAVLSHSMGAAIALAGASEGWLGAHSLVCVNPMVGLSMVRAGRLVRRLAAMLARLGLATRVVPGGSSLSISTRPFEGNRLSSDPARYARNAELARRVERAAIGSPTIGWLSAAYEAMARLSARGFGAAVTMPVMMALSEEDPVCSTPEMLAFARTLPNAGVIMFPDARHEILMETDAIRRRFWAAFDEFMAAGAVAREKRA